MPTCFLCARRTYLCPPHNEPSDRPVRAVEYIDKLPVLNAEGICVTQAEGLPRVMLSGEASNGAGLEDPRSHVSAARHIPAAASPPRNPSRARFAVRRA